jgi:hypothetical protein
MNYQEKICVFNNLQICFSYITYNEYWYSKVYSIIKLFKYIDQTNIDLISQFYENCFIKYGSNIDFNILTKLEQIQILEIL